MVLGASALALSSALVAEGALGLSASYLGDNKGGLASLIPSLTSDRIAENSAKLREEVGLGSSAETSHSSTTSISSNEIMRPNGTGGNGKKFNFFPSAVGVGVGLGAYRVADSVGDSVEKNNWLLPFVFVLGSAVLIYKIART